MQKSSSETELSQLKGPAWPGDFSQDLPEYSDEEMKQMLKESDAEARARRQQTEAAQEK
jgi:hypothetical protein